MPVPVTHAAPTKLISYQGRITDSNGQPITDGSYSVRFKIYSTSADCTGDTAFNLVWGPETQATVQMTNGLFSVVLGTVTTMSAVVFDSDYWLQVKVGANPVFSPCDRLTTAPFAANAINTDSCNSDATCETQAISATGDITLGTGVQIDFFDETGDKVYWYSNTYGTGIEASTLTNWSNSQFRWRIGGTSVSTGTEKMLLTGSGLTLTDDLTVNGYDIDLIRGDSSYIHSVGRISFDWTAGTYDGPDYHGLTSKAESNNAVAGAFVDDLSINSYSNIIATIDSNDNSVSTFKVQNHAMAVGGGTDLLTLDESGNLTVPGSVTASSFSGAASNAQQCVATDGTCDTNNISATGTITNTSTITTPGYISITGVSDASGNLRFSAANPYIKASSYFIAPGGAYFNVGTVYTEAAIQARGGINDDGASAKLDLIDADGVNITAGALFMGSNTVIDAGGGWHRSYNSTGWYNGTYGGGWYMSDSTWIRSYGSKQVYIDSRLRSDGGYYKWDGAAEEPIIKYIAYGVGTTACPTGWKVVGCNGSDAYCTAYNMGHEGAFCSNFEPPHDCPSSGNIICVYAP